MGYEENSIKLKDIPDEGVPLEVFETLQDIDRKSSPQESRINKLEAEKKSLKFKIEQIEKEISELIKNN